MVLLAGHVEAGPGNLGFSKKRSKALRALSTSTFFGVTPSRTRNSKRSVVAEVPVVKSEYFVPSTPRALRLT
jgi:hypothetical protein